MSDPISDWKLFNSGDESLENRYAWLGLEIIKCALQDAVKGIDIGIIDPVTLQEKYCHMPMRDDMSEFINGAEWIQSKACADLCQSINGWSDGILKINPDTFVALLKRSARDRTTKPKNKKYGKARQ
jgi:hypothetical protein